MSQMIYKKMSEVMKEIGYVGKDQKNVAQGFKFRGVDQFVNALYPALTKHGVFMVPRCTSNIYELKEVTRSSGKTGVDKLVTILMEYDFFAEDGSKVTVGPIPAEGLDSGDKATNKALSAALKYALIQTFSVPTQDMAEADTDSPEIGTKTSTTGFTQKAKELQAGGTSLDEALTKSVSVTVSGPDKTGAYKTTETPTPSFRRPKPTLTTVKPSSGDDL